MGEIFENFDVNPLGSASIAQVLLFHFFTWFEVLYEHAGKGIGLYEHAGKGISLYKHMLGRVHRAILRGDKNDVVVKVQHPGIRDLMMTDIHNLQAFVLFIQKTDMKFDLFSITREMEKQICKLRVSYRSDLFLCSSACH
ncbi:hypothetical protein GOBAR_AA05680 [Gossypium barbadense]|uniref:ABC1 atypical kinase-like domain-containing protein n=1 Tax=Gossypium barbadense TaxID=3634 RepID=A0A2P5YH37_GOSBA|nr:hypothetical protein GOBAR_AA05680 [Gossypium barbadense]